MLNPSQADLNAPGQKAIRKAHDSDASTDAEMSVSRFFSKRRGSFPSGSKRPRQDTRIRRPPKRHHLVISSRSKHGSAGKEAERTLDRAESGASRNAHLSSTNDENSSVLPLSTPLAPTSAVAMDSEGGGSPARYAQALRNLFTYIFNEKSARALGDKITCQRYILPYSYVAYAL